MDGSKEFFLFRLNRLAAMDAMKQSWLAWNDSMPAIPADAEVKLGYSTKDMPQRCVPATQGSRHRAEVSGTMTGFRSQTERAAIQRISSINSCKPAWMISSVGLSTSWPSCTRVATLAIAMC